MFVLDIVPVDKNNYDGQLGGIFGITVKIVYGNCCLPKFVLALPWASKDWLGNHTLTNMPHVCMQLQQARKTTVQECWNFTVIMILLSATVFII